MLFEYLLERAQRSQLLLCAVLQICLVFARQ